MFLSMNWISDFVDFTGLDKVELIHRFSLSTAEVENEIFFKGSDISYKFYFRSKVHRCIISNQ